MSVSVVIPYFDDPRRLTLVLAGLGAQRFPLQDVEVIIADDGSPQIPHVPAQPFRVRHVRQLDKGFRAAAARNLGASVAQGEFLCFVDGDTVPGPDYLKEMVGAVTHPYTVAVGRRRHVDLTGWGPPEVRAWFAEDRPPPPALADPQWLRQGYRSTANLSLADDTSFRFVISAVLAMRATMFHLVGGFDPSFTSYGGEDWDIAQRCWLAGADLTHVPAAVAWHDGPDAAARPDAADTKNRETLHLAKVLTHPIVRPPWGVHEIPDIAVELDASSWTLGQIAGTIHSMLRDADVGVWLAEQSAAAAGLFDDPRVHAGPVPERVQQRCRTRVRWLRPAVLEIPLPQAIQRSRKPAPTETGSGTMDDPCAVWTTTRELGWARLRQAGEPSWTPLSQAGTAVPESVVIERWIAQARSEGDTR